VGPEARFAPGKRRLIGGTSFFPADASAEYIDAMTALRIAFQGELGAYSEDAIRVFWGPDVIPLPCPTFAAMFDAVKSGRAEGGVLPVENLVVGPIASALDVLDDYSDGLLLGGTTDIPVVHALLGIPGATLEQVKTVLSHPVALDQCHRFLQAFGAKFETYYDTAGAARHVSVQGDPTLAAIASHAAAKLYGLEILSDAVQDEPDNWTRFLRVEAER
jgi:prephenate dehydratase